tara:strand:- start:1394 stop:1558 length:165 start_codon:yes stop_codon:yes gene_type:complete
MTKENLQGVLPVLGVNGGVLGVVSLTSIETILSITLLFLTCIWTSIKIYKLLKK